MTNVSHITTLILLAVSTTAYGQLLERIDPDRARSQKEFIDRMLDSRAAPPASPQVRMTRLPEPDEDEGEAGCTLPYSAFVPADEEQELDYDSLYALPSFGIDPLLENCSSGSDLVPQSRKLLGPAAAAAPKTVRGWRIDTKNVREFRDPTGKLVFQFAPATSTSGERGVYLGRGAVKIVNGKATTSWARRIVPSAALVEYVPRLQAKFLGIDFGSIGDFFDDLWDKAKGWIEKNLPKWISQAIQKIGKELEKWALKLLADLIGEPGRASQIAPTLTAEMGRNDAAVQSLNEYLATVDTVRTTSYSITDKVFISLSAPVVRTGDIRAAIAVAKTIDQLK